MCCSILKNPPALRSARRNPPRSPPRAAKVTRRAERTASITKCATRYAVSLTSSPPPLIQSNLRTHSARLSLSTSLLGSITAQGWNSPSCPRFLFESFKCCSAASQFKHGGQRPRPLKAQHRVNKWVGQRDRSCFGSVQPFVFVRTSVRRGGVAAVVSAAPPSRPSRAHQR